MMVISSGAMVMVMMVESEMFLFFVVSVVCAHLGFFSYYIPKFLKNVWQLQ